MKAPLLKSFLIILLFLNGTYLYAVPDQKLDLRILVDISREVLEAQPNAQHLDALHLLITQLPESSQVGIWTYGRYVNYLVHQQPVNLAWRNEAITKIKAVRSVATSRNLGLVLRKACYDIKLESNSPRSLLLISAGGVNVDDQVPINERERQRITSELLPQLREAGYIIHTIALSNNADVGLLTTLAKETGGFSLVLNEADEIYSALEVISQAINQANSVPINQHQFAIDANINKFDALLRHKKGQAATLQTPSGEYLTQINADNSDGIQWHQGKQFTLISVEHPELGHWRISDESPTESRVFVEGLPKVKLEPLKNNYFSGENLALRAAMEGLSNGTEASVSVELIGNESFRYVLQKESGREESYSGEINGFYEPGIYYAKVIAEELDYTRVLEHPFQVYPLLKIDISKQAEENGDHFLVTVQPMDNDLILNQSTIVATITDVTGEWTVSSVNLNDSNQWQLRIEDDGKSSEYQVKLDFKGVTESGRLVHFQPKPLLIEAPKKDVTKTSKLITPYHKSTASIAADPPVQTEIKPVPNTKKSWGLVIIAAISVILGVVLLAFYFYQGFRKAKKEPLLANEPTIETTTKETINLKPTESNVGDLSIDDNNRNLEVEIDLNINAQNSEAETNQETITSEIETRVDSNDEELIEGTELAGEWSNLDAESNVEGEASNTNPEIEIEFDFDAEEEGGEEMDKPDQKIK